MMRSNQVSVPQLEPGELRETSRPPGSADGQTQPAPDLESHSVALLATMAGLLVYSGSMAWVTWTNLLQLLTNPVPQGVAVFAMTLQVIVPLVVLLSYAVIHLSCRRAGHWFLTAEVLCLLGFLTAVIDIFARVLG